MNDSKPSFLTTTPSTTPTTVTNWSLKTFISAFLLALVTSAHGLLTTASKNANGKYSYNVANVPLLAEMTKLFISFMFLRRELRVNPESTTMTTSAKTVMLYPIPSLIFLAHQAVSFPALILLDPTTFLVLGNLKIVITGVLTRVFLKKPLSAKKWFGLVLVTVGACATQIGKGEEKGSWKMFARFSAFGYLLGIGDAVLSALGGVYVEFVFKKNVADSIHWQNMQMYAFGTLFNSARLTYLDITKWGSLSNSSNNSNHRYDNSGSKSNHGATIITAWPLDLFSGHSLISVCVVANLAFGGLLVSHIIKNVDAIAKVFATACAMFLTPTLSFILFAHVPNPAMFGGVLIASFGMMTYYDVVSFQQKSRTIISSVSTSESNGDKIIGMVALEEVSTRTPKVGTGY